MNDHSTHSTLPHLLAASLALGVGLALAPVGAGSASALPTGFLQVSGTVTASTTGTTMTITQTSATAIAQWDSFSIAAGEKVTIVQPDPTSTLVLRVTSAGTTTIAGELEATGRVILLNPSGILLTGGSTVTASGFVASTGGMANTDIDSANYALTIPSASNTAVTAQGAITSSGQSIALVAAQVEVSGSITAPHGNVLLASLQQAGIIFDGPSTATGLGFPNGLLGVTSTGAITAPEGSISVLTTTADGTGATTGGAFQFAGSLNAAAAAGTVGQIAVDTGAGATIVFSTALADSLSTGIGSRLSAGDPFPTTFMLAAFGTHAQQSPAGDAIVSTTTASLLNMDEGLLAFADAAIRCVTTELGGLLGTTNITALSSTGTAIPSLASLDLTAPNVSTDIAGLGHIVFNEQSEVVSGGTTTLAVTGIHLTTVAGDEVRLFQASCSRPAATVPSPESGGPATPQKTLPAAGVDALLPGSLALGLFALAGVLLLAGRRGRRI